MSQGYDQFFKKAQKAAQQGKRFNIQPETSTPEQEIKKILARRMTEKKNKLLAKRKKTPTFAIACVVIGFICSSLGYVLSPYLDSFSIPISIGFLNSASAKDEKVETKPNAEEKKNATSDKKEEKTAEPTATAEKEKPAEAKSWSGEELSFFNKLNERKKEMDEREKELNKLDEELQAQKVELEQKIKQLEEIRSQIATTLKDKVQVDSEKVDKLVQVYSGMKPQQAAKVIESLNEDLAVDVLDKMKKKNASDVLNMMDAQKAKKLSELLAGYKR